MFFSFSCLHVTNNCFRYGYFRVVVVVVFVVVVVVVVVVVAVVINDGDDPSTWDEFK